MVIILNYVLFGIVLYVFAIPLLEELTTVIVQWLEVIKGKLILQLKKLSNETDELTSSGTTTNVIGFQLPEEIDYEEEFEEDE